MEENTKGTQKLSYEELENIATQLSQQNQQLYARLQQADMTNMLSRLKFLFKVIENAINFPEEFVTKCVTEIMEIMAIPEVEDTKED